MKTFMSIHPLKQIWSFLPMPTVSPRYISNKLCSYITIILVFKKFMVCELYLKSGIFSVLFTAESLLPEHLSLLYLEDRHTINVKEERTDIAVLYWESSSVTILETFSIHRSPEPKLSNMSKDLWRFLFVYFLNFYYSNEFITYVVV